MITAIFDNLGYFTENECIAIKDECDGKTYMDFNIAWSNMAGNCTLIVESFVAENQKELESMFLHYLISKLSQLKREGGY